MQYRAQQLGIREASSMAMKRQGQLLQGVMYATPVKPPKIRKLRSYTATSIARRYIANMRELPVNAFVRGRTYLEEHHAHAFDAKYRDPVTRRELSLMTFWVKDDRTVVLIECRNKAIQPAPTNGHVVSLDADQPSA